MTWTGTLTRVDVGTGAWRLVTSDGRTLGLYGKVPPELDGQQVVVRGDVLDGAGIGMVGDLLVQVRSVSACEPA